MAGGSTLHSLLFKLGFDTSSLASGGGAARSELRNVANAARDLQSAATPVAAAVANIGNASQKAANDLRGLVTAEQAAAEAMKKQSAAAGPLVTAQDAAAQANIRASAAAGGLVSSSQAAANSMKAQYAAAGPLVTGLQTAAGAQAQMAQAANALVTPQQAAAQALRAANAAAGPLVAGVRGAGGAMAAAAPAANLAAAGFQAMGNGANGAAGGLNNAAQAAPRTITMMKQTATAANEVGGAASFMQRTLSMAFAFSGGVAVTNVIGFVSNALVGFNSRLEQAHLAFGTLLGDGAAGDRFIQQMEQFANFTPFDFAGVEDAAQRFLAMGVAADQVLPELNAIGDAVSALGGGKEKLDRVTLAIGQMTTAGRVNAQDMRQLTEAGIPAWQILADHIGKSVAETRKLSENGLIPAREAVAALLNGMEERFSGMMARQARTAQGAFSTIRDSAYQTISGAVQPLFAAISTGMVALADFFTSGGGKYVAPVIYGIGTALAVALIPRLWGAAAAVGGLEIAIGGLTVPILPLIIAISTLGIMWQENFGGMRTALEPLVGVVTSVFGSIAGALNSLGVNANVLVNVVVLLATAITTKFVVSLIAGTAASLGFATAQIAIALALRGTGTASMAAASGVGVFSTAMTGLGVRLMLFLPVIGLIIAAGVLLITNWERVGQGIRVLHYVFIGAIKGIMDAASNLPFVGDMFKGFSQGLQEELNHISADAAEAEARINAAANIGGGGADPLAEFRTKFTAGADELAGSTDDLVKSFGTSIQGVVNAAKQAGGDAMSEMAKAIREKQNAPMDALKSLHEMVRHQLDPMTEIARLMGELTNADIAAGMASQDPAVVAQTEATVKLITDRLDELTNHAYSAGTNAAAAYTQAFSEVVGNNTLASMGYALNQTVDARVKDLANTWNKVKPSQAAILEQQKKITEEMRKTGAAAEALSALNSAFGEISRAAHRFFDQQHQDTLQAIDDARKQKNAILDAKAALIQAPINAAQDALDFQRRKIEEWRLRSAVATATDPAAYRDAVLALQDFLAQQHINDMQSQADKQKDQLNAQKDANDRAADAQKAAEDARYAEQSERFDRELELLRRYLEKHPGEWQNAQSKILNLLKGYGLDYKTAGSTLSEWFVIGLKENIDAATEAAKAYADLIPAMFAPLIDMQAVGGALGGMIGTILGSLGSTGGAGRSAGGTYGTAPGASVSPPGGGGGQLPKVLASGEFQVMSDNLLALLHRDEMVAPANIAHMLRSLAVPGFRPGAPIGGFSTMATGGFSAESAVRSGADSSIMGGIGKLVIQIGDQEVGEIVDRQLQKQDDLLGEHGTVTLRSSR